MNIASIVAARYSVLLDVCEVRIPVCVGVGVCKLCSQPSFLLCSKLHSNILLLLGIFCLLP